MYIKINNVNESVHAQLALFKAGYRWASGDQDLLLNGVLYSTFPYFLRAEEKMRMAVYTSTPRDDEEYTVTYDKNFNYAIGPKARRKWIFGTKNGAIVARDAEDFQYIVCTFCTSSGHLMRGVRRLLENLGYDTSGFNWTTEGQIIFK